VSRVCDGKCGQRVVAWAIVGLLLMCQRRFFIQRPCKEPGKGSKARGKARGAKHGARHGSRARSKAREQGKEQGMAAEMKCRSLASDCFSLTPIPWFWHPYSGSKWHALGCFCAKAKCMVQLTMHGAAPDIPSVKYPNCHGRQNWDRWDDGGEWASGRVGEWVSGGVDVPARLTGARPRHTKLLQRLLIHAAGRVKTLSSGFRATH